MIMFMIIIMNMNIRKYIEFPGLPHYLMDILDGISLELLGTQLPDGNPSEGLPEGNWYINIKNIQRFTCNF